MKRSENGSYSTSNLNPQQIAALNYLKQNQINILMSEMINSMVQSNTEEPIVYMIRYLANLSDKTALEKENIKIENLEKVETIPLIKEFHLPEESTVFLKKFINNEIYEKLKEVKTTLGGHISHIIYAGMKVDNKETVGIYATDGEAYTKFQSLFQPAINFLQDYDKYYSLFDIPDHRGIFKLPIDSKINSKVNAIRFKYARNLKNFPYLPYAKSHTKKAIHEILLQTIRQHPENVNGTYYDTESISHSSRDENPELFELENKFFDKEENFFNSFGLSKEHSGIFLSEDRKVAYLLNFNDHLQIVVYDESANFKQTYKRIRSIHDNLSKELEFDYNPSYGYLTTCPSNIGMGLKISSWLDIPNTVNQGNFLVCCKRWSLRFKKHLFDNKVAYEIISKHKLNVSEISFVNSYMVKVTSLINFENNLLENPNYVERQLDSSKLKENVRNLYQSYFDKYKFVVTPNRKSFNSMFQLNPQKNVYNLLINDKESYIVFRDFIFDYVTAIANINMFDMTKLEKRAAMKELYSSKISSEDFEEYDSVEKNNLKKTSLIFRRNTKKYNFSNSMAEADLSHMYLTFLQLANRIQKIFGGSVLEQTEMDSLYNLEFKFIFEELNQMLRGKNSSYVCAYLSQDEKTLIVFNLIDHIKIVSLSDDGKIKNNYNVMSELTDYIDSQLKLENDDVYGHMTCKPLNCGSAFEIRLLFEDVDFNSFKKLAEKVDLDSSKVISKSFEIFNRNKIYLSSTDILKKFSGLFATISN